MIFALLLVLQAFAFLFRNVLALRVDDEIESHPRVDSGGSKDPAAEAGHVA